MLIMVRVIAWPVWAILLYSFMLYVPIVTNSPSSFATVSAVNNIDSGYNVALITLLIAVAALEVGATFWLRHYLLIKPFRNDRFKVDTVTGSIRFIIVHIINWFIICSIATEGMVFASLTKKVYCSYPFFVTCFVFMILHFPRVAPYKSLPKAA